MTLSIVSKSVSSLSKAIVIFAVSLAFAVITPAAFAQRGGGSHGGGHVGGHVGGAHGALGAGAAVSARGSGRAAASASGGRAMGAGSARLAAGGAAGSVASERTSTRGYSRNIFVSAPGTRDGNFAPPSRFMPVMSQSSLGARTFAADNRFWEDPPQQGRPMPAQAPRPMAQPMTQPMNRPMSRPFVAPPPSPLMHSAPRTVFIPTRQTNSFGAALARPMVRPMPNNPVRLPGATPGAPFVGMTVQPIVVNPFFFNPFLSNPAFFFRFHPIGGCFSSFNCSGFVFGGPFFNPFFFGFGFSPCFSGGFGCGFGPFGFGDLGFNESGFGGGFGNGWFYPPAPEIPPPPVNPTQENPPLDFAPNYFFVPEVPEPLNAEQKPVVKLALKDGTIFDVYSYWLENNQLFYITTYNIKTSIPVDDLDLQKTVDLNQKLGVTFTLGNKPPDQQQPPPQPQDDQQQP